MVRNGLQYLLFNSGPVTTTGIEACLFYDPDGGERPTIQLYCVPDRLSRPRRLRGEADLGRHLHLLPAAPEGARQRPAALRRPGRQPLVDCNFFGDPDDLRLTLASLRHARDSCSRREPFSRQDRRRNPARRRPQPTRPTSTASPARRSRPTTTRRHRPHGARTATRWRWSTPTSGCAASRACG